jgi:putative oxidoreductase
MIRIFPTFVGGPGAVGLLLLRLVSGAALMLHGWGKVQHAYEWMNAFPNPAPPVMQAVAAYCEFGGGLGLLLGLLTPLAALGVAGTMTGALVLFHLPQGHPFVAVGQPSYESALLYLAVALMFLLAGPGKLSVDALLFGGKALPRGQP